MINLYQITNKAIISFSGGRTSGYMLKQILDAHGGKLPKNLAVVFANTGKEMPQTLDFVRDCGEQWNIPITWLECRTRRGGEGENKYIYQTVVVDYDTASRNGEPFAELIKARRYAPNPVARFCTQELKVLRVKKWGNDYFNSKNWVSVVGLRADEQRRVAKMRGRKDVITPLADAKVTKEMVGQFWKSQPFDLRLPNNNGVTDFGNCDVCFLKGAGKKISIIRERPDLADWWIQQEKELAQEQVEELGKGAFFRSDQPSYAKMKIIATDQSAFDFGVDDSVPCFCSD